MTDGSLIAFLKWRLPADRDELPLIRGIAGQMQRIHSKERSQRLFRPFAHSPYRLSCSCVAPNGSGCDPGDMSGVDPDHKTSFLRNYELYKAAKERGESEETQRFALLALNQIHLVSDVPAHADREANAQMMHDLLGP